jgi:hypothetical protein
MRYQARWSNGYWKSFDSRRFEDIEIHKTQKEAEHAVLKLNKTQRK